MLFRIPCPSIFSGWTRFGMAWTWSRNRDMYARRGAICDKPPSPSWGHGTRFLGFADPLVAYRFATRIYGLSRMNPFSIFQQCRLHGMGSFTRPRAFSWPRLWSTSQAKLKLRPFLPHQVLSIFCTRYFIHLVWFNTGTDTSAIRAQMASDTRRHHRL